MKFPSGIVLPATMAFAFGIISCSISSHMHTSPKTMISPKSLMGEKEHHHQLSVTSVMTEDDHKRLLQSISSYQWMSVGNDNIVGGERDNYGSGNAFATSKDGRTVIVGAFSNILRVFQYNENTKEWNQMGGDINIATDKNKLNKFDGSLDMSDNGDVVVINGSRSTGGSYVPEVKLAHIYRFVNGQWVQQGQELSNIDGDGNSGYSFAESVAISGDGKRVIAGSPSNSQNIGGRATVYEYDEDEMKWKRLGDFLMGDRKAGQTVDINDDGSVAIVGTSDKDSYGARAYRYMNGQWAKLGQDFPNSGKDNLGSYSVAMSRDGTRVILGMDGDWDDENDNNGGGVWIYEYNEINNEWSILGDQVGIQGPSNEQIGLSVDMNGEGNVVIIGTPLFENGYARVYQYINGEWFKQGEDLFGFQKENETLFGRSVAISRDGSNRVFVGTRGIVRAFEFGRPTSPPARAPTMEPTMEPTKESTKSTKATKATKVTKATKATKSAKVPKLPKTKNTSKTDKDTKVTKASKAIKKSAKV